MYESETLKKEDIVIGKVYKKDLLDNYIIRNNCMLVKLGAVPNVYINDSDEYKVIDIFNKVNTEVYAELSLLNSYYDQIIVIDNE